MRVRSPFLAASALGAVLVLAPCHVAAQPARTAAELRPWRPIVTLGGGWTGSQDLGRVRADTRRAAIGASTPDAFTLFTTESRLGSATAAELGVVLPLTTRWAVGLTGGTSRPVMTTAISGDAESAPPTEASQDVSDYVIDLSLSYQLPVAPRWRVRPFLVAGGGYVRQLPQGNALVETGRSWHSGVGLRWWLRGDGANTRALGLVGQARWLWRRGALSFTDGSRSMPSIGIGMFVGL